MTDLLIIVSAAFLGLLGIFMAWREVERLDDRYWHAIPVTMIVYGALIAMQMLGAALIMVAIVYFYAHLIVLPEVRGKHATQNVPLEFPPTEVFDVSLDDSPSAKDDCE